MSRERCEDSITYAREYSACGSTTYAFERCHACGDVPWKR